MRVITRQQLDFARRNFAVYFVDLQLPTDAELVHYLDNHSVDQYDWCKHIDSDKCLDELCPDYYAGCWLCQSITLCKVSDRFRDYCSPRIILHEGELHDLNDVYIGGNLILSRMQKDIQYPHWDCEMCKHFRKTIDHNTIGHDAGCSCYECDPWPMTTLTGFSNI